MFNIETKSFAGRKCYRRWMKESPAIEDQSLPIGFQNLNNCAVMVSSNSYCDITTIDCSDVFMQGLWSQWRCNQGRFGIAVQRCCFYWSYLVVVLWADTLVLWWVPKLTTTAIHTSWSILIINEKWKKSCQFPKIVGALSGEGARSYGFHWLAQ